MAFEFEELTKTVTEFTSDIAGKVKNSVGDIGKKVIGPRLDIVEHAHEIVHTQQLQEAYLQTVKAWATHLKKEKVAATKVTAMSKALLSYECTE